MLHNVDENETNEIHDNVAFYDANISGMTEELKALRGNIVHPEIIITSLN